MLWQLARDLRRLLALQVREWWASPLDPLGRQARRHVRRVALAMAREGRLLRLAEGFVSPQQGADLQRIARDLPRCDRIAEIGVNLGISGLYWLLARPDALVTGFDIAAHPHVRHAAACLAKRFPGRYELVVGDSRITVPRHAQEHGRRFHLVFIDGGHGLDAAWSDLRACEALTAPGGVVIMDDICDEPWGDGPRRAWERAVAEGLIVEVERREYRERGKVVRGVAVGRYRGGRLA